MIQKKLTGQGLSTYLPSIAAPIWLQLWGDTACRGVVDDVVGTASVETKINGVALAAMLGAREQRAASVYDVRGVG